MACIPFAAVSARWILAVAALLCAVNASSQAPTVHPAASSTPDSRVVIKYVSTNTPLCPDALSAQLMPLASRNRNVLDRCVQDALDYSLFPYSGFLPSTDHIRAIVASTSCLQFLSAVLLLPELHECNLGGLDLQSVAETLLMTSEDLVTNRTAPLTRDQFFEFIAWRHDRNVAKQSGLAFDNTSESAVTFDAQLVAATLRQQVSLTDNLLIQVKGTVIGSSRVSAITEDRSLDDPAQATATVAPSGAGSESVARNDVRQTNRSEISVRESSRALRIAGQPSLSALVLLVLAVIMWSDERAA
ncbi:hypothetical protein ATCC90586_005718 [Pythium insidiosum]|nr:hypothetical protein ATCC90586_005718 [Pythium insidiosum]